MDSYETGAALAKDNTYVVFHVGGHSSLTDSSKHFILNFDRRKRAGALGVELKQLQVSLAPTAINANDTLRHDWFGKHQHRSAPARGGNCA